MDWSKGQLVTALRSGVESSSPSGSSGPFLGLKPVRSPNRWGTVYVGKLPFPGSIGWWSKLGSKKKINRNEATLEFFFMIPMVIFTSILKS